MYRITNITVKAKETGSIVRLQALLTTDTHTVLRSYTHETKEADALCAWEDSNEALIKQMLRDHEQLVRMYAKTGDGI